MNLWIKFTKENYLKYISHLDLMRLFQRTFRRCNIPIKYSQGFNPQPKMTIGNPLALGVESAEEFMEIDLYERIPEDEFIRIVNSDLPEGIKIIEVKYVDSKSSITSFIDWSYYEIQFVANNIDDLNLLKTSIMKLLEMDQLIIEKEKRKGNKVVSQNKDVRPFIGNITISEGKTKKISDNECLITINCLLKSGDKGNLKPVDLLKVIEKYTDIDIDIDTAEIKRLKIYSEKDNKIEPLM